MNTLHAATHPLRATVGPYTVEGFSISALATYFMVKELDVVFDLGSCPVDAVAFNHVLLSHVHLDHIGGLPTYVALREMRKLTGGVITCPAASRDALLELLAQHDRLEGRTPTDRGAWVRGVQPGEEFALGKNYTVEVIPAHHRLVSVGYTIKETRQKLRDEFKSLSGEEIKRMRLEGVAVTETSTVRRLTYLGDFTAETLLTTPTLGLSETLLLEVTYLGDTPPEMARQYGHLHLDQLVEIARTRPETLASLNLILKHFSMRYTRDEILNAVRNLPREVLERTWVWIPSNDHSTVPLHLGNDFLSRVPSPHATP
jgi:ribonuclease Z